MKNIESWVRKKRESFLRVPNQALVSFHLRFRLQLPSSVAKTYQQFRDRQRLYPLLMRLRPEFEPLREQLLHRDPVPRLDTALSELIAEETRLRTLATHRASPEGGFCTADNESMGPMPC